MKIIHAFADYGGESEALAVYGDVHRFTIDPKPNEYITETTTMDLLEETPDVKADLGVFHPKCSKYADTTSISGNPDDHEDQIPRAREIARETCEHWVIENKPAAPLNDPVILDGRMFGLPIAYRRAFETNFPVPQPPRNARLGQNAETSTFYFSERSTAWWRAAKGGLAGDYPKQHIAKNVLPLPYVHHIARAWLDATSESKGVADYSNYDAEMDKKRALEANRSLEAFTDGGLTGMGDKEDR